jgi:SWI/SNF-related matrix-associated actin-dependent regulator of chromatin subfamily A-like protein 1
MSARTLIAKQRISISDNLILFYFPYDLRLKEVVQKTFSAVWDKKRRAYTAAIELENLTNALSFADEYSFFIYENDKSVMLSLIDKRLRLIKLSKSDESGDIDMSKLQHLKKQLRNFQTSAVEYIVATKDCIIADEQGLGKTIEAIASVEYLELFPCAVICPLSLKLNWKQEIESWVDNRTICVYPENNIDKNYHYVIANYDRLDSIKQQFKKIKFKCIIFDESHYIKNIKSIRTKCSKSIAKNIDYKLELTGTPVLNRPQELIAQLSVINKLREFGGKWKFGFDFCDGKFSRYGLDFSGNSNLGRLNVKLRSSCMIRRTKKDVAKELPDKVRTYIPIDIDNKNEYDRVLCDLESWLQEKELTDETFIQSLVGLSKERIIHIIKERKKTITDKTSRAHKIIQIEKLKQVCAAGKLKSAINWITDFIESEKLILFAFHKTILKQLSSSFPDAVTIFSENSQKEIQRNKQLFQEDENCRLIICALGSSASSSPGGLGHTLHAASNVAFLEFGWNPAIHDQAEDRAHRIGQTADSVNCWYFTGKNTIDPQILSLIENKRKIVNSILTDRPEIANNYKDSDILEELISYILKK